eukprot:Colp12_sorted_trinity150504_noHs@30768
MALGTSPRPGSLANGHGSTQQLSAEELTSDTTFDSFGSIESLDEVDRERPEGDGKPKKKKSVFSEIKASFKRKKKVSASLSTSMEALTGITLSTHTVEEGDDIKVLRTQRSIDRLSLSLERLSSSSAQSLADPIENGFGKSPTSSFAAIKKKKRATAPTIKTCQSLDCEETISNPSPRSRTPSLNVARFLSFEKLSSNEDLKAEEISSSKSPRRRIFSFYRSTSHQDEPNSLLNLYEDGPDAGRLLRPTSLPRLDGIDEKKASTSPRPSPRPSTHSVRSFNMPPTKPLDFYFSQDHAKRCSLVGSNAVMDAEMFMQFRYGSTEDDWEAANTAENSDEDE